MKKETILVLAGTVIGMTIGSGLTLKAVMGKWKKEKELSDKHFALMLLFHQWLKIKQEGKSIADYFHKNEIKKIAIYGMSYAGERLYDELKKTDIEIVYAIDKNADSIYAEIDVISPEEELPYTQAIVVTSVFYYDEIKGMLKSKTECPIISLEDILFEL